MKKKKTVFGTYVFLTKPLLICPNTVFVRFFLEIKANTLLHYMFKLNFHNHKNKFVFV